MTPSVLRQVLESTGYLDDGEPAPTVLLGEAARGARRGQTFEPDALWRGPSALTIYFKYVPKAPDAKVISSWRREVWNEGFSPLLWVISPARIDVYNGFSRPTSDEDADKHRLQTFQLIEAELRELDAFAGRLSMETGQFWLHTKKVDRKTSVDAALLSDLASLERDLVDDKLPRSSAQGLIGRVIFTQYLIDRGIVTADRLNRHCGVRVLPDALRDEDAAKALFGWLTKVFNGDMFPESSSLANISAPNLSRVADFLEAVNPETGQRSLFPYQFDVIPVELISAIYEQFAHSSSRPTTASVAQSDSLQNGRHMSVHYTRLSVVSLILDELMTGLSGNETVLDLTCGSGVFLVEAFRRLVALKAGDTPSRELIRETLYQQIYGVDISEAAIRVAAFSLYLAALELDPDPHPPEALRFKPLIERTLMIGDGREIELTPSGAPLLGRDGDRRKFDILVGNPPWTFKGRRGTAARRSTSPSGPRQPRGEGLDFVTRAADFAHDLSCFGFVLPAPPFFAGSSTAREAALNVVQLLAPATFINLSALTWLFPTATMPAALLLGKPSAHSPDRLTVVNVPWSLASTRSQTFEIAPSDVGSLSIRQWEENPTRLKTAVFGRGRDIHIIDDLRSRFTSFESWSKREGVAWRDGLQHGDKRPVGVLRGMEILEAGQMSPFSIPSDLPRLEKENAYWPRSRDIYRAPLVLVQEGFKGGPRPVVSVVERDIIYTEAYFGLALPDDHVSAAYVLAGILSSAVAAWFFLMTASEFGVWKRRLHRKDLDLLPVPDPIAVLHTEPGQELLKHVKSLRTNTPDESALALLDNAVFDIYNIASLDRVVILDGMQRAGWQWKEGREHAAAPASSADLEEYAAAFLSAVGSWLQATNKRRMRAEIFNFATTAPLRIVRFVLEDRHGPSIVRQVESCDGLSEVLDAIGERLHVQIASAMVGQRELRVHGEDEVVIIKPSTRRFWTPAMALTDADAVVIESFAGAPV